MGQRSGETRCKLPSGAAQECGLILPTMICDNMYKLLPTRENHPSLGCLGILLGFSQKGMEGARLTSATQTLVLHSKNRHSS